MLPLTQPLRLERQVALVEITGQPGDERPEPARKPDRERSSRSVGRGIDAVLGLHAHAGSPVGPGEALPPWSSETRNIVGGSFGCRISARLPTASGQDRAAGFADTVGVHSGHRSTSAMTAQTRSGGAGMSTVTLNCVMLVSCPPSGWRGEVPGFVLG